MSIDRLTNQLRRGDQVFMGGSTGEVVALTDAIARGAVAPVSMTTSFVPGVNVAPARVPEDTSWTNPFPYPTRGAFKHVPLSYGAYASWLSTSRFDACVVHVAPPRRGKLASLGSAVEFSPIAWRRSDRLIAVINPAVPDLLGAVHLDLDDTSLIVELPGELPEYRPGMPDERTNRVATAVAALIDNGAALQIGLGKVPDALMLSLRDRTGLRIQSGMMSDGVRPLLEGGALDCNWAHTSCVHVGSREYYRWLHGRNDFAVLSCDVTHDPGTLARAGRLVAVNGALQVDLFGQANLEYAGLRPVSGVGGAADFARAAALDPHGLSVVALPATGPGGTSRIVSRLVVPVSLPRHDIDVVATEHGSADLRGLTGERRAERLIDIAAPEHRAALARSWGEMQAGRSTAIL